MLSLRLNRKIVRFHGNSKCGGFCFDHRNMRRITKIYINAEMNIGEWVRGFHRTRVVAEHTHCHYSSLFLLPEVSIFIHSKRSPQQLMKLRVFCCQASKWIDFFWRSLCTGVKRTMKSGGIMIAGFIVNENSDNSRSFFLFAGDLIFLACSHISQSSSEENVICHWKTR